MWRLRLDRWAYFAPQIEHMAGPSVKRHTVRGSKCGKDNKDKGRATANEEIEAWVSIFQNDWGCPQPCPVQWHTLKPHLPHLFLLGLLPLCFGNRGKGRKYLPLTYLIFKSELRDPCAQNLGGTTAPPKVYKLTPMNRTNSFLV